MKTLPVYEGGNATAIVQVDEVDYLWACQYRWHLSEGYAARSQRRGQGQKPTRIFLHREIMGLKHAPRSAGVVDHINGNRLDNRRTNLRVVTEAQNAHNRKDREGCTSRHRGVSWYAPPSRGTRSGRWRVQIMVNGKRTLVGLFRTEAEAAAAAEAFYAEHMPYRRQEDATASVTPGAAHSVVEREARSRKNHVEERVMTYRHADARDG